MDDNQQQSLSILALFFVLPKSLEKSAHMLILRQLASWGWKITVITVDENKGSTDVIEEEWFGIRIVKLQTEKPLSNKRSRVIKLLMRQFPDKFAKLVPRLSAISQKLHSKYRFDLVLSLYHPVSSHSVARTFSQLSGCRWVALTKDFYSWPSRFVHGPIQRIINHIKKTYEQNVYMGANAILVTDYLKTDYIRQLVSKIPVETLAHCYDETTYNQPAIQSDAISEKFVLTAIGLTDRGELNNLNDLFIVLSELLEEGVINQDSVCVKFIGARGYHVQSTVNNHVCRSIVEILPPVPHFTAINELMAADCLFFSQFPWGTRRRLADYLGSRKPILAYPEYPGNLSNEVLRKYDAARVEPDRHTLKIALREFYQQFMQQGQLNLPVNEELVESFSSKSRAKELDAFLRKVQQTPDSLQVNVK